MAPCRKKLMLFHTSPFMIFLTMCRNNFCTLFIVFYVTKIKTKMSQAGNNWVHVGTRALKRRHNWLRPVPTERFPQEEDEYWLYSSTIPSNPATLLDQRWILSPRTHYHAFKKSTSQMAQAVKKPLQCRRHGRYLFHPWFNSWVHLWVGPWVRKIPWRRKWQPTPLFLPGESHEQRSLVGYSPWSRK